ncbi:hypothetical protein VPH166E361_0022 [Vibrio phage 166E36-1]
MIGKILRKILGIPELSVGDKYEIHPTVTTSLLGGDKFSIDWEALQTSDKVKIQMQAARQLYK